MKLLIRTNQRNIIVEAETAKEALDKTPITYPEIVRGVRPATKKEIKQLPTIKEGE